LSYIINTNETLTGINSTILKSFPGDWYDFSPNTYESEFSQLFRNLLTNAIKFQKQNSSPIIRIWSEKLKNKWKFSVSDNGIGIDPKYHEKIFEVFQRLHTDTDYEGRGIGLAFSKKIVQLHKGEIWVESSIGQGATFHFTISSLAE
jgi:light-regulated signal transduction histidine kinase (bacteriophytochrome)